MSHGGAHDELRERRLSAILAADIVGYSKLMAADEVATLRTLNAHRRELVDPTIVSHRGRVVKTTGDGMLVEFASAVDAVRCAVEIQRGMAERNEVVPPEKRTEFRIGINVGDIIGLGDDIYGDGVNVAARLEAMSEPGGIYVSRAVRDPVRDKLAFSFEDLGEVAAKNIPRPIHVFRVRHEVEPIQRKVAPPNFGRRVVVAAFALLVVTGIGAGTWFLASPLVQGPSPEVQRNLETLVGRWEGVWDNNPRLTTSLTIESVTRTGEVTGSYVFISESPTKFATRIADNAITFGSPYKFTFRLRPDGKMEGTRSGFGLLNTIVLTKPAGFFPGRWEGIWDNDPRATTSLTIETVAPNGEVTGSYVFMSESPSKFVTTIKDNAINFGSTYTFTFRLRPDGKIEGTRNGFGVLNTTVLTNPAAFSPGRWEGIWNNDPLKTVSLIIETVAPTGEVGGSYVYMSQNPLKFIARISDNAISFGNRPKFTFRLLPDGKMEEIRDNDGLLNSTVLTRK
jgi:class 3 adenylate cyclase